MLRPDFIDVVGIDRMIQVFIADVYVVYVVTRRCQAFVPASMYVEAAHDIDDLAWDV
jgi:hypothetical protein